MAKEPGRRYATAADFAADLRRFLNGEPVRARPVGRVGRTWRWCRRKPGIAGLTAALVLVVLGGFAGILWQWHEARANAAEADEQRIRAEAHLREAEAGFQQSHRTVNNFVRRVFMDGLLSQPGTQALRRELLRDALYSYRGFLDRKCGDPGLRADLAETYFWTGYIVAEIGDKAEALESFRQAFGLYQQLAREDRGGNRWLHRLIQCHDQIGQMLGALGRPEEAIRCHRQSLEVLEELGRARPRDALHWRNVAALYGNLGNVQRGRGQNAGALRSYDRAREIQERLVRDHPTDNNFKYQLATTYNNLGVQLGGPDPKRSLHYHRQARALREQLLKANPGNPPSLRNLARSVRFIGEHHKDRGQHAEALAAFKEAAALLREASNKEPAVTLYRSDLGELHLTQGDLHRRCGQHAQAVSTLTEASRIFEKLVAVSPTDVSFRMFLAVAYDGRAMAHRDQGELDKALEYYQQVLTVVKKSVQIFPRATNFRRDLAETYGELTALQRRRGRPTEAAALALERKKVLPEDPKQLFTVACDLAQCIPLVGRDKAMLTASEQAERRRYAGQAVEVLRQALRKGYKDGARLKTCPELAPLREDADFRRLLAEAKKRAKQPTR
jgi:tetratricopeptide (TPR) repeat protein